MVDLIDLTALKSPTTILPSETTDGINTTVLNMSAGKLGKRTLSGSLTANTYKEILSLTTSGSLRLCGVYTEDATSRTVGLKIVIDGTTVFDGVSATQAASGRGIMAVGISHFDTSNQAADSLEWIRFNASLSLQIKSSITETDKITLTHLTVV